MVIRLVVGALLASAALMFWGFVIWTVSPVPFVLYKSLPNGDAVVKTLKEGHAESGVYLSPWPSEPPSASDREEVDKKLNQQHKEGPLVQLIYRKDGNDPMAPEMFAAGFAHFFVSCLLVG